MVKNWQEICLPMQGTWVQTLVLEGPTCRRATMPMSHNYIAARMAACLDGRRLNGKPTKKGLYIHGGKTVLIK